MIAGELVEAGECEAETEPHVIGMAPALLGTSQIVGQAGKSRLRVPVERVFGIPALPRQHRKVVLRDCVALRGLGTGPCHDGRIVGTSGGEGVVQREGFPAVKQVLKEGLRVGMGP